MLKPKKGFLSAQLNTENLLGTQFESILKAMDEYADHYAKWRESQISKPDFRNFLPSGVEINIEAEREYPVKTHSNPKESPFVKSNAGFFKGADYVIRALKDKSNIALQSKKNFIERHLNSIRTYLHHLVIGLPSSKKWMICFKDGNTLNCQRENLQYIRKSDNTQRHSKPQKQRKISSRYLGVSFRPAHYQAQIRYEGKTIYIGKYENEIDAAKAYNNYAKRLFGEKAKLNTL